jgi:hypothetical protein
MLSPADDLLISMARRARATGCDDGVDAVELAAGTPLAVGVGRQDADATR